MRSDESHSAGGDAAGGAVCDASEVVLKERGPIRASGGGLPAAELVARGHERGVHVSFMVANVDVARAADMAEKPS